MKQDKGSLQVCRFMPHKALVQRDQQPCNLDVHGWKRLQHAVFDYQLSTWLYCDMSHYKSGHTVLIKYALTILSQS